MARQEFHGVGITPHDTDAGFDLSFDNRSGKTVAVCVDIAESKNLRYAAKQDGKGCASVALETPTFLSVDVPPNSDGDVIAKVEVVDDSKEANLAMVVAPGEASRACPDKSGLVLHIKQLSNARGYSIAIANPTDDIYDAEVDVARATNLKLAANGAATVRGTKITVSGIPAKAPPQPIAMLTTVDRAKEIALSYDVSATARPRPAPASPPKPAAAATSSSSTTTTTTTTRTASSSASGSGAGAGAGGGGGAGGGSSGTTAASRSGGTTTSSASGGGRTIVEEVRFEFDVVMRIRSTPAGTFDVTLSSERGDEVGVEVSFAKAQNVKVKRHESAPDGTTIHGARASVPSLPAGAKEVFLCALEAEDAAKAIALHYEATATGVRKGGAAPPVDDGPDPEEEDTKLRCGAVLHVKPLRSAGGYILLLTNETDKAWSLTFDLAKSKNLQLEPSVASIPGVTVDGVKVTVVVPAGAKRKRFCSLAAVDRAVGTELDYALATKSA